MVFVSKKSSKWVHYLLLLNSLAFKCVCLLMHAPRVTWKMDSPSECMIFSSQPGHPPHISGCFLFGLCGFRGGEWRRWHKWVNKAAVEKKLHLPNTMYNYAPQSRGPYRQWLLLDLHVWLLRWPKKILHLTVSSWWALCLHLQLSSLFLGLE